MVDATYVRWAANDKSYFSIFKKEIRIKAETAGFDSKKLNDIDVVITAITTNLPQYGGKAEVLATIGHEADNCYLEMIRIEHGSQISNQQQLQSELSADRAPGTDAGSIKSLSDKFDSYTMKDWGTITLSRIYKDVRRPRTGSLAKVEIRPLVVMMPGQSVSGDGTYYQLDERYLKLLVADGLGHGQEANLAVNEAVAAFRASNNHSPSAILKDIHQSILKTRGIVGTVIVFDFETKIWTMAGIGNISTRMSNFLEIKNLMSHNGIVGHNIPLTMKDQEIELKNFHQVTLCSDGIKSRWELAKYPGINRCDLSIQAAAIYKDYARHSDDMSVVIAKINTL